MAPAAAFAEVLDRCLDHAPIRDAAAAGRSTFGVGTRSLFWFEGATSVAAPRPKKASDAARSDSARAASPLRLVPSIRPPAARPARILSAAQRDALNQMIGLGARLDETFTLHELRSEFRALARLYHPDRHQDIRRPSPHHAASTFVTLRSAYEVLKKAA
jgi:hypothetical protein